VAAYKRLRGGIFIVDHIPRTASGKILRRLLVDYTIGSSASNVLPLRASSKL
jgi:acyl-coenzyme A synthetase/AMP-(fatty) acid ligase